MRHLLTTLDDSLLIYVLHQSIRLPVLIIMYKNLDNKNRSFYTNEQGRRQHLWAPEKQGALGLPQGAYSLIRGPRYMQNI